MKNYKNFKLLGEIFEGKLYFHTYFDNKIENSELD